MNHHPIYQANKREQQTQQQWIQRVAGNPRWEFKDLQAKLRNSEDVDFKFSASTSDHEYVELATK